MRNYFSLSREALALFCLALFISFHSSANAVADLNLVRQNLVEKTISDIQSILTRNPIPLRMKLNFNFSVSAEQVSLTSVPNHSEIIPTYSADGLRFTLRYDEVALQRPELLIRELSALVMLVRPLIETTTNNSLILKTYGTPEEVIDTSVSPHFFAELLTNAKGGSASAQARLNRIYGKFLKVTAIDAANLESLHLSPGVLTKIQSEILDAQTALDIAATDYLRTREQAFRQNSARSSALETFEAKKEKLNDLILGNDRAGVKAMLEAYLPWAVMEPAETQAWKTWLEAIAHPDLHNTTVALRGIDYDNDKIQRRQTERGERIGFMSPVLTKNQGSYTRRLRSLSTNRSGDRGLKGLGPAALVTEQMWRHSMDPVASNFLSFTFSPVVSQRFIGMKNVKKADGTEAVEFTGGLLAVKMDSRRLIPNIVSDLSGEIELLAPLIVFPDEVVVYKDRNDADFNLVAFIAEVTIKTGVNFSMGQTEYSGSETRDRRFQRTGYEFLQTLTQLPAGVSVQCRRIFSGGI